MVDVSVIIPTFGIPQYLNKAVESVLNQSLQNIEIIVVDDNNPDTEARRETEKLITSISDDRLHYLKHPHNLNGAVARNTGLAQATGKYISFLDSDDEYKTERLEKCFNLLETSRDFIAGVYTGCEFRRKGKVYRTFTEVKSGNHLLDTLACTFMFCTGSNIFVKKSVADEINGFDGTFLRHQDYEFLVRIFQSYSLEAIPEVLVIKNNENMNLPNVEKMVDIKKQYLIKFKPIIKTLNEDDKKYIFHSQYLQIAEAAQKTKKYKLARRFYKKAKDQGGLTLKEQMRRIAFWGQNLIKR